MPSTPLRCSGRAAQRTIFPSPPPSPPAPDSDEHLPVATTRPETILGDTAVAVHPEDERCAAPASPARLPAVPVLNAMHPPACLHDANCCQAMQLRPPHHTLPMLPPCRYKHLVGREVVVPMSGGRRIKIIADEYVDREFGTGALKITPGERPCCLRVGLIQTGKFHVPEAAHAPAPSPLRAGPCWGPGSASPVHAYLNHATGCAPCCCAGHDVNDYEIGKRFNLETINIMNDDGTLNAAAGAYAGLDRFAGRGRAGALAGWGLRLGAHAAWGLARPPARLAAGRDLTDTNLRAVPAHAPNPIPQFPNSPASTPAPRLLQHASSCGRIWRRRAW